MRGERRKEKACFWGHRRGEETDPAEGLVINFHYRCGVFCVKMEDGPRKKRISGALLGRTIKGGAFMKHNTKLRWAGFFLTLVLILSAVAVPAAALTPAYPITGAYRSSTYHQNLLSLPRTGDKGFDTVAVAMTQVGYHEGNSTADFDGENAGGYKNYTEYNRAFGTVDGTYGYAWCAAFVSWCLTEANAADAAGGLFVSCSLWIERLRSTGQYSTRASGYQPRAGDLIFFRSSGAGRASDHVGIVRYISGGRVYTVEGNSSDKVSLNSYALTSTYIVGYGKPQYGAKLIPSAAFSYEDRIAGWYVVTGDFVNVRAAASTASAKSGKLDHGDMICVSEVKNGWGTFTQNGKTRYVSLDYLDLVSPITYRIKYDAVGGENGPAADTYYSFETRAVSAVEPIREGYTFEGWEGADGTLYGAGDTLPVASLTLTAVWREIPPPPAPEPPAKEPTTPEQPDETPPESVLPPASEEPPVYDEGYLLPPSADGTIGTLPEENGTGAVTQARGLNPPDVATAIFFVTAAIGVGGWYIWRKKRRT